MQPPAATVHVNLSDPTADTAVLELLTQQLRRLLLTLDVGPSPHDTGDARPHPSNDLIDAGSMQMTVTPTHAVLRALVEMVRTWVAREERVAVTLQIKDARLTILGAVAPERTHTIDTWVQRALAGTRYDDIWYH
jgi:hypothetical protein